MSNKIISKIMNADAGSVDSRGTLLHQIMSATAARARYARNSSTSATTRKQAARGLGQSGLGCPTGASPTLDTAQSSHTHTRTLPTGQYVY